MEKKITLDYNEYKNMVDKMTKQDEYISKLETGNAVIIYGEPFSFTYYSNRFPLYDKSEYEFTMPRIVSKSEAKELLSEKIDYLNTRFNDLNRKYSSLFEDARKGLREDIERKVRGRIEEDIKKEYRKSWIKGLFKF